MKIKRNDIYLILAVLAIALFFFCWQRYNSKKTTENARVIVEQEGKAIGDYPLGAKEQLIFTNNYGKKNVLTIQDGQAFIEEADCPDKLCVKHKPISRNGESIICLPHKLAIRIVGGEEEEVDVILR